MIPNPRTHAIDPLTDPRWDAYVRAHPRGSVYHLGAWATILERSYAFHPQYLAVTRNGSIAGVLPLFRKKGLVSDARTRSIPVFAYGGPLADDGESTLQLIEAARDKEDVATLSINTDDRRLEPPAGFEEEELPPRWMVEVPEDLDELRAGWRKTSNNLFRNLKKAEAGNLEFRTGESRRDMHSFHRMYVRTMRKHRSLPRSYRQLRLAQELLGDDFKLFMVSHAGRDIAGGVYHVFGGTVELVYNGSEESALSMRPNHVLYWKVMQWAAERGLRAINLGGADRDTPLAHFKEQWGAVPCTRYRLTHHPHEKRTRTDALVSVGYGADDSDRGLMNLAWRVVPPPLLRLGAHVAYRYA